MFLMKKFNYKPRKRYSKMMIQQKFWKKTQRYLLDIFMKTNFYIGNTILTSALKLPM